MEAFKKNGESLDLVQTSPDPPPPPLPGLDSLTGIFFIVYLALIGHEIDFEQNLYFSLTKVVWHLENFAFFPYVYTIKQIHIAKEMKILSMRPTYLKIKKIF